MSIGRLFSEADLQAVREATAAAESHTGGEIVPYIVERVLDHEAARWRGAALGALGGSLVAALVHAVGGFWGVSALWWISLPALAGAGCGYLLAGIDAIGRHLISDEVVDWYVTLRAESAFLEEEVFATRDRSGILVLLALFERRAVILGDEAINRAVPEGEWEAVVADLVSGLKAGRTAAALVAAIERCGAILELHKVALRPDDEDELPNAPRLRER